MKMYIWYFNYGMHVAVGNSLEEAREAYKKYDVDDWQEDDSPIYTMEPDEIKELPAAASYQE